MMRGPPICCVLLYIRLAACAGKNDAGSPSAVCRCGEWILLAVQACAQRANSAELQAYRREHTLQGSALTARSEVKA